jgi:hypothetical protein
MKALKTKTAAVAALALFRVLSRASAALPQSDEIYPKKDADERYGHADANGEWATRPRFMAANPFSEDGAAWARPETGKYAAIDKTGEITLALIPDVFDFASVSPGGVVVARAASETGEDYPYFGLANEKGWIAKPECLYIKPFEGTDLFLAADADMSSSFLLNDKGETVMKLNGLIVKARKNAIVATAKKDGAIRRGVTDAKGNWIVKPRFNATYAYDSGDCMAFVDSNLNQGVIDGDGKIIVEPEFNDIPPNPFAQADLAAAADSSDRYGFIDKTGKWAIEPRFFHAENFSKNGLALVEVSDAKHGFVNLKGEIVIAPDFIGGHGFDDNGYAGVRAADGKRGVIKENGEWTVPPRRDDIPDDSQIVDGTAVCAVEGDGGKLGFINREGDRIVKPSFIAVDLFDKRGCCPVQTESSRHGFIDSKGNRIVKPPYHRPEPFGDDDYAVALAPGKKFGLIDGRGKFAPDPVFSELSLFGEDLVKGVFETDPFVKNYFYPNLAGDAGVPVGYDPKREKK